MPLCHAYLALSYSHQFGCDVVLDLNCYRKFGHNETDEPAFTQPHQSTWIRERRRSIRNLYRQQLHTEGLDAAVADSSEKKCEEDLENAFKLRKEPLQSTSLSKQNVSTISASIANTSLFRILCFTRTLTRIG